MRYTIAVVTNTLLFILSAFITIAYLPGSRFNPIELIAPFFLPVVGLFALYAIRKNWEQSLILRWSLSFHLAGVVLIFLVPFLAPMLFFADSISQQTRAIENPILYTVYALITLPIILGFALDRMSRRPQNIQPS